MKKLENPFSRLNRVEWIILSLSILTVVLSFIFSAERDPLNLITSLVGVTALIFVAKGMVFGQVLCVVFALLYGLVSFLFSYYGEMITYLGMSAPAAIASVISWLKNPYGDGAEVKVARLKPRVALLTFAVTVAVTVAFYFILGALGTANLWFSTLSVATSFLASALTFLRSPYYAVAYAANDLVLIVLWLLAALESPTYLPMIFCFVAFLANDVYGFISWRRMRRLQELGE